MSRRSESPRAGRPWSATLAGRIILIMMGIFMTFATTLGVTWYVVTVRWLTRAEEGKLDALGDARAVAIEGQVAGYHDALRRLATSDLDGLVRALVHPGSEPSPDEQGVLAASMVRHLRAADLDGPAVVFGPEGQVLAASRRLEAEDTLSAPLFREALTRAVMSRPFSLSSGWYIDLARPITDDRGRVLAVLALRLPAAPLLRITGGYQGLGATGETVLGRQREGGIEFLVPLRFAPDPASLGSLLSTGTLAAPMIAATMGQSGESSGLDYRGVAVLANYRPVAGTSWGMVVKQDLSEVLESARSFRLAILLALVGLLGAALALVFPTVQTALQPLRTLEGAARRVADGDLTVEVPEDGTDDLRALGSAFNAMVARLAASRAESLRRQEELESFTYVVSHDLKAPLRGVNNLSEWLEQDMAGKLEAKSVEHLRLLRERVASMNQLIDGLLDLSRVGRVDRPEQRVFADDVVAAALDDLPPREGIAVTVPRPLPGVRADPLRLRQVFQNLIGNAVAHHPGPTGTVEIAAREVPHGWEFSVKDDGAGIEPRYHERIFGIFQVLQRRPGTESTGVGLAIVKKIVEERGGSVRVESEGVPGKGTTFYFTWPDRADDEELAR